MVREGWKSVAVREDYHKVLKQRADKNRRSVSGELEFILIDKGIVKPLQKVKQGDE